MRKLDHTKGVQAVWWPARRHSYSAEFKAYRAATGAPDEIGVVTEIFDYAPLAA